MRTLAGLALLAALACNLRDKKKAEPPPPPPTAAAEVQALAGRLVQLAVARDTAGLRAHVDAELGRRLEVAALHARARAIDQFPLLEKAAKEIADPAWVKLKGEELVQKLQRALPRKCAFEGPPEPRTPRWPTKRREGWDFLFQTAALTEHVFDAYARCTEGYNLEVRFARRQGAPAWKVVGAEELPFGATRPAEVHVPSWD